MPKYTDSDQGKITYFRVVRGYFCTKSDESNPNSVARKTEDGRVFYDLQFRALEGVIFDIKLEDYEHPKRGPEQRWKVFMYEPIDNEVWCVTLPASSRVTNGLLTRLPNIDMRLPVKLVACWFADDEKGALYAEQAPGLDSKYVKIQPYWTRDNPGNLPELKQVTVNNKVTWDSTDRIKYFDRYVNDERFKSKLLTLDELRASAGHKTEAPAVEITKAQVGDFEGPDHPDDLDDTDDLPF